MCMTQCPWETYRKSTQPVSVSIPLYNKCLVLSQRLLTLYQETSTPTYDTLVELSFGSVEEIHHFKNDESANSDYVLIKSGSISENSTEMFISIMPELEFCLFVSHH